MLQAAGGARDGGELSFGASPSLDHSSDAVGQQKASPGGKSSWPRDSNGRTRKRASQRRRRSRPSPPNPRRRAARADSRISRSASGARGRREWFGAAALRPRNVAGG